MGGAPLQNCVCPPKAPRVARLPELMSRPEQRARSTVLGEGAYWQLVEKGATGGRKTVTAAGPRQLWLQGVSNAGIFDAQAGAHGIHKPTAGAERSKAPVTVQYWPVATPAYRPPRARSDRLMEPKYWIAY